MGRYLRLSIRGGDVFIPSLHALERPILSRESIHHTMPARIGGGTFEVIGEEEIPFFGDGLRRDDRQIGGDSSRTEQGEEEKGAHGKNENLRVKAAF